MFTRSVALSIFTLILTTASCMSDSPTNAVPYIERQIDTFRYLIPNGVRASELKVSVCPMKYDKKWAYAVEIDDGPTTTLTVTQPLLARYSYSTASPGLPGGKLMPFVGGAAIYPFRIGTQNSTFLSWDQVRTLQSKGWSILNHSYWHSGYTWDPKGALTDEQIKNELYWSLALIAAETSGGRAPSHFVYPNGYMEYKSRLAKFGIVSASRVGGKRLLVPNNSKDLLDIDRNYLDESVWSKSNNPLEGLPMNPLEGSIVIDFTHGTDGDPNSLNNRRWVERLTWLEKQFGASGNDSMWCAPTDEIINYDLAYKSSVVVVKGSYLELTVPHVYTNTALTIKLSGVGSNVFAPKEGTIFKHGGTTWWTTPVLGAKGIQSPFPNLKRVYHGDLKDVEFSPPISLAGIRIHQFGTAEANAMFVEIVLADGKVLKEKIYDERTNWGVWHLIPIVPNRESMWVKSIRIPKDPSFKYLEIWSRQ